MMRPFGPKPCESRSTLAAARALNINAKLVYQWQKALNSPCRPLDPHKAAEVHALRAQVRRQAQELEI
jgi:transposase